HRLDRLQPRQYCPLGVVFVGAPGIAEEGHSRRECRRTDEVREIEASEQLTRAVSQIALLPSSPALRPLLPTRSLDLRDGLVDHNERPVQAAKLPHAPHHHKFRPGSPLPTPPRLPGGPALLSEPHPSTTWPFRINAHPEQLGTMVSVRKGRLFSRAT